nr:hypothetical protein [uncultured Rhodoferax sp.]
MFITDPITYNVNDRGRKARGQDRNFDTGALARFINGNYVQEKVKHGDMLGFLGHWPRIKFGMEPAEGGVVDGKAVVMPTAVRTVELRAETDGTITHRTQFLDTDHGEAAYRLFKSKAGGFSSAIDVVPGTSPAITRGFYGFDYVYEPNFTKNRGHAVVLDGVSEDMAGLLDAVLLMASEGDMEMRALFDSLHGQHLSALEAMERLSRQNDWLINRLARLKGTDKAAILDSVLLEDARIAPMHSTTVFPDFEQFKTAPLAALASLPVTDSVKPTSESEFAERRYGFKG